MSYWLNPRISVEDCKHLDQIKLDAFNKASAELDATFKEHCEKYGEIRALQFRAQMLPIVAMMLF